MAEQKQVNKREQVMGLIGIVAAISLVASIATSALAYPSQNHRDVASQLNDDVTQAMFRGPQELTKYVETDSYKKLEQSAESKYSTSVANASGIAQMIGSIVLVCYLYLHVRENKVSKTGKPIRLTIGIVTAASLLAYIVGLYPSGLLTSIEPTLNIFTALALSAILLTSIVGTYVVLLVFEYIYNRKHPAATK